MKLSESLVLLYQESANGLTIGEFMRRNEHRGFGFLFLLFSLPTALPMTPPGVTVPFATVITLLALQLIAGKPHPQLPNRIAKMRLFKKPPGKMLSAIPGFVEKMERFCKPRLPRLVEGFVARKLLGIYIILIALAMAFPFPVTNSIAASGISLIGLAMTEEDGAIALVGLVIGLGTLVFTLWLTYLVFRFGPEILLKGIPGLF